MERIGEMLPMPKVEAKFALFDPYKKQGNSGRKCPSQPYNLGLESNRRYTTDGAPIREIRGSVSKQVSGKTYRRAA